MGGLRLWLPVVGAAAAACATSLGPDRPDDDDRNALRLESIRIEPANRNHVIDNDRPATQTYTATAVYADGSAWDITPEVAFRLNRTDLGTFRGPHLTSATDRGGRATVLVDYEGMTGAAAVTFQLHKTKTASAGVPDNPQQLFRGEQAPHRAVDAVYPNLGAVVPPNLRELEFHFRPGENNSVFELKFTNEITNIAVYLDCSRPLNGGCIYTPDAETWHWLAMTNRGEDPVYWQLRATDNAGHSFGVSQRSSLSITRDDIAGALYYWTTSNGSSIVRYDFGRPEQTPQIVADSGLTDGDCVGCHALSRDGTKMILAGGGTRFGRVLLMDVRTQTPLVPYDSTPRSAFSSWSPDASRYVGVFGGSPEVGYDLNLFDGDSGDLMQSIRVGGLFRSPANQPDWSADGRKIAYVKVGYRGTGSLASQVYNGAIELVTQGDDGTWSTPSKVTPNESDANYYQPSFSPDSELVAFIRAQCPPDDNRSADCDGYRDHNGRLSVATLQNRGQSYDLGRANRPGFADDNNPNLTNSYPRWAPFVFRRTLEFGSRLMWVTFSSTRAYGLRKTPRSGGVPGTLLWMAAIDPDQVGSGDPSFVAFALPFQDVTTSNHTAQWAEQAVPMLELTSPAQPSARLR